MRKSPLVSVSSRSFSKHPLLRKELQEKFSDVNFNQAGTKLEGKALVDFLQGATHAIIGLEVINDELLKQLPKLKAICKMGTGVDKIDFDALKRHDVAFSSTAGVNKRSVSELVLGLIFTLYRRLSYVNSLIKQDQWQQPKGQLLSKKKVGIIGFGTIGHDLAELLSAFGCECLAYDVQSHKQLPPHVQQVDLDTLLAGSDIISLHIPYLPENHHIIGAKEFAKMKASAILINTARGGLIDEDALYKALTSNKLAGAALDVFEHEPEVPKALMGLDNFFATSHIAGSTEEAIHAMGIMAIERLQQL